MGESFGRFARRVENIKGATQKDLARAALLGGVEIERGAKELVVKKGHVRTGTLLRNITTQLGRVTITSAEALVGVSVVYGRAVENLPATGRRAPTSYYYRGRLVKVPGRGEGGGYLFPAAEERLPRAVQIAAQVLSEAIARGAKG